MINGYQQKKKLLFIDAYDFKWKMDGKKGTVPKIVLFDYETHKTYNLSYDCDLSKCQLLKEYLFVIKADESYGKVKEVVIGVHNATPQNA